MAIEKSAGAVIYRVTEDGNLLFLLLQPATGKPWGFPKGKLNPGESEEESARREIAEEAGLREIDLDPKFRHVVHYTYRRGRTLIKKEVVYFLARAATPEVCLSWEHIAFCWVSFDEALRLVVFENARETLRKVKKFLAAHYPATEV